jgi:hypothetical protein
VLDVIGEFVAKESGGPIELIRFHDDQIAGIKGQNGKPYVVVKRICENLGVAFACQLRNLTTTHAHWAGVTIMMTPDERGSLQEHTVMPIDRVPMWLTQIKLSKIAPERREKLKLYQIEAADVLANHYLGTGQKATSTSTLELILQQQMIANSRYDGSIALLSHETASLRQEVESIKAEQLRFATQGRTVIYYVPVGYHRFSDWCKANSVPKLGAIQADEIHRARDLSSSRSIPVYRCEVQNRPPAYYFSGDVLTDWLSVFRRRHPRFFYRTFPFVN